jgi:hypothetical protein
VAVKVQGGRTPYYQLQSVHDLNCRAIRGDVYGQGTTPNFLDYDHVRATFAGHPYDLSLGPNKSVLEGETTVPKVPEIKVSATTTAKKITVQGTVTSDADGQVKLTYRAKQPDGTPFEQSATVTIENGAFSFSTPLTRAQRKLTGGTVTAEFLGDSGFVTATAKAAVTS